MDTVYSILKTIGLILIVLLSFNIIIFVHELGHFLAARWRGLHVDRFQIWFGKPIWKKTINGVQYGLGWIPAGGFVALPQMAPMESIEGTNSERDEPLPPIKPIDKIIVAFAGPLFSFLLAVVAALIIWKAGTPDRGVAEQKIGYIKAESPAAEAGFKLGDKITKINGEPVVGFSGDLDSITNKVIFSEGEKINFTVEREVNGETKELTITSGYEATEGSFLQRSGMRQVGIGPEGPLFIQAIQEKSPASLSDFKVGDEILSIEGNKVFSFAHFQDLIKKHGDKPITIIVKREGKDVPVKTMAMTPTNGFKAHTKAELLPLLGVSLRGSNKGEELIYPSPAKQIGDSGKMMWTTVKKIASPSSSIGAGHLSGPIGIGKVQYRLLGTEFPVRYLLYFWVLFNVNLAIFNLLPFPVLDGGHIVMAMGEMIRKKPMNTRVLEAVQTFFVLVLLTLFVFVSVKDLFSKDTEEYSREGLPEKPEYDLTKLKDALGK